MEEIIKELDNIVQHFKKEERNFLSRAKDLLNRISDNGSYTCKYSHTKIHINELTIKQVKEIIQDYQNYVNKRKYDTKSGIIRDKALELNRYSKEHPYGE